MNSIPGIRQTFRRLFKLYSPNAKRKYFLLMGASFVLSVMELAALGVIGLLTASISNPEALLESKHFALAQQYLPIDGITTPGQLIPMLAIAVVIIVLVKNSCVAAVRYNMSLFNGLQSNTLAVSMVKRVQRMPYQWITRHNPATMMTHISWATGIGGFMEGCQLIIGDILLIALLFSATVMLDPLVVLAVIAVLGIISSLLFRRLKTKISDKATTMAMRARSASVTMHKMFYGFKDLRIFGRTHQFLNNYEEDLLIQPRINAKLGLLQQLSGWSLETIGFAMLGGMVVAMHALSGLSSPEIIGTLTIAALAAWRGLPAVIRIISQLATLQGRLPSIKCSLELLDEIKGMKVYAEESSEQLPPMILENTFEANNLSFSYEGSKQVLHNISFAITRGQSIGIVGFSGAGKSTLTDLIIGFLEPSSGEIAIDGTALDRNNRAAWMKSLGYIQQSPYIFDGTLAENVAFSSRPSEIDKSRVLKSCKLAAVTEFLEALPEKENTHIGDRGLKLSGGQQQRVCIARALYNDPKVLILDEATSSLDTLNEKSIQQTIYSLRGDRTLIVVAHRLSTVEECDQIIWLDKGEIAMYGSPTEVLPEYRKAMTLREGISKE